MDASITRNYLAIKNKKKNKIKLQRKTNRFLAFVLKHYIFKDTLYTGHVLELTFFLMKFSICLHVCDLFIFCIAKKYS